MNSLRSSHSAIFKVTSETILQSGCCFPSDTLQDKDCKKQSNVSPDYCVADPASRIGGSDLRSVVYMRPTVKYFSFPLMLLNLLHPIGREIYLRRC